MLAFFSSLLVVGFGVAWKLALLNLFFVASERLKRIRLEMRVWSHELGHKIIEESEEIIEDQHLTVAVRTRADADGGNRHGIGDGLSQLRRNGLKNQRKRPGCLKSLRIVQQRGCLILSFPLNLVST